MVGISPLPTVIGLASTGPKGPIGARSLVWGANSNTFTVTVMYYYPYAVAFNASSAAVASIEIDAPGYLANLYIRLDTNAADTDYTFTVYLNGSPTTMTATVPSGSTTTVSDITHQVTVVAGDKVHLRSSRPAGTFGIGHGVLYGSCERVAT